MGIPLLCLAASCIRASDGILSVRIEAFDDIVVTNRAIPKETMSDTVKIEGIVVRSPPLLDARIDVTIAGGVSSVSTQVMESGLFRISVAMNQGVLNPLVVSAADVTGAISTPFTLAVTHIP